MRPDQLRLMRQMKQFHVTRKLGISIQRYSKLENNDRLSSQKIVEILEAMGYTREWPEWKNDSEFKAERDKSLC